MNGRVKDAVIMFMTCKYIQDKFKTKLLGLFSFYGYNGDYSFIFGNSGDQRLVIENTGDL